MRYYRFEDMQPGLTESFSVTITQDDQEMFERLSKDVNRLHKEKEFAVERGFRDRVVYGMLASAFYSTLVGVYLPGENCLLNECKVSYHKPVYIGDCLKVEGTVADVREGTQRVKISGRMTNQNEEVVNSAVITVSFTKEQL